MSSAYKYTWERKDGSKVTRWRAQWNGPDGKPRTKRGYDRKADAEAYASDREAEIRHGVTLSGERPSGKTTVETWSATWLEGLDVRASTAASYRYAVQRINASLGGRSLSSLRPSELRAWRRGLTSTYAQTTADQTAAMLAMLLRAAVEDRLLERSPMPTMKGGSTSGRVVDPGELLTLDEVRRWDAKLPGHARGMAIVAAATGLRQGELLGLQKRDVDFLRGEIRVVRQLVSPPNGAGRPEYGPPKTAAGVRTVPLPDEAAMALSERLRHFPPLEGEPLFLGARGQRWKRGTFRQCWDLARQHALLPEWAHWHALRDVSASALIRSGMDLRTVMTILGHASSEETLRTYARVWPDAQDRARKALNDVWSQDSEHHGNTTEG